MTLATRVELFKENALHVRIFHLYNTMNKAAGVKMLVLQGLH